MTTASDVKPQLLKARIGHTRIFAALVLAILLVTGPQYQFPAVAWWLGYGLLIAAMLGRALCTLFIGGRKNTEILAIGPYAVVRNPLYVASFLGVLGLGLAWGMITVLAVLVLAFVLYYQKVVAREEGFLRDRFGAAFDAYCAKTPRWWPDWSLWQAPEAISVQPKFVLITLRDAAWFVLALPLIELIKYAQAAGYLPVLWLLP